jgi:hypothetical protein
MRAIVGLCLPFAPLAVPHLHARLLESTADRTGMHAELKTNLPQRLTALVEASCDPDLSGHQGRVATPGIDSVEMVQDSDCVSVNFMS